MGVSKTSVALLALATLASAGLLPRTTAKQVYPGFKNLKYVFSLYVRNRLSSFLSLSLTHTHTHTLTIVMAAAIHTPRRAST